MTDSGNTPGRKPKAATEMLGNHKTETIDDDDGARL